MIRGGLAALPRGQYEAADALGLDYWQAQRLIIMPQALKISIPGIVNTFIGLFKDTTLVAFVGLLDPLRAHHRSIRADINWKGIYWEPYIFVGADLLRLLLRHVALFDVSRAQAQDRPPVRRPPMTEPHPDTPPIDRARCKVTDEVAIQIVGMNKWYGTVPRAARHRPDRAAGRAHRDLRAVRLGQVDADPLHQPAGGAPDRARSSSTATELTNDLKNIDKVRSEVGMVFQHFNLFPHLTILENCTLAPIWVRKIPKKEAEETAMYFLRQGQDPRAGERNIPASCRAASSSAWPSRGRSA